MPHHFTKNTLETTKWCNTCKCNTQWLVSDGRLGRCKNDHHKTSQKLSRLNSNSYGLPSHNSARRHRRSRTADRRERQASDAVVCGNRRDRASDHVWVEEMIIVLKLIVTILFGFILLVCFCNSLDCYPEEPNKVARNIALSFFSVFILITTWV